ncbi:MAG TPA: TonB-dependent receptor [Terriglobales bacterium]|nr:TonB-dependent receptor [Terriglobales bacterium]
MESAFRKTWTYLLTAITLVALSVGAFAQGGAGELTGLVTDATGAVVSGVTLKLTNSATGEVRTTVTTPAGTYNFSALPIVGTYALEIATKGFKTTKVQNVVVSVGTITTRDIKLEVGAATEQVTVEAGAQLVQTEDSSLSQLIDRRVWENMPLEARNANDFINLVAGAVPEQEAGGTFRGAAVNGVRTGAGNYMVEGTDNNEQGQGGVAICGTVCGQGGANTSISPDAIEEYRVIANNFSAEYGKVGGFVTDTVLKSGTNKWHGSLFEYNRIQALTAQDWFSNAAGLTDHLVRNQFGGSVGGPIVKDKTFFYATVEAHRFRESAPVSGESITSQFLNFAQTGQLATFVNSVAPCNTIAGGCPLLPTTLGPVFSSLLQKFPLAVPLVNSTVDCSSTPTPSVCFSDDAYGNNFAGILPAYPVPIYGAATESQSAPLNQYRFSVKLDHNFSSKDRLGVTYLFENVNATLNFGGGDDPFSPPLDNPNRAQTLSVGWTHTISPTVLNQFKIGYVRRTANFTNPGTEGDPEFFSIDPTAISLGSGIGIPQFFTENEFQYKDDVSITHGKHQIKFGGEDRRTRNGSSFHNDAQGHFATWGAEGLVTDGLFTDAIDAAEVGNGTAYGGVGYGGWYYAGASVVPSTGAVPNFYRGYRANEVAFYGQDDWRISSRLTLNLGLRWEYFGPPHNFQPNIDSNVYYGQGVTPFACPAPCNQFFPSNNQYYSFEAGANFQVHNSSLWNKDLNNFAPRIGFAYDVLGNQKLVVRAGFGAFYDRIYNNIFENIRFNPPYFADELAGLFQSGAALGPMKTPGLLTVPFTSNALFVSPVTFPNGLPKPVPRHMDQNLVAPYYMQEHFGFQYALAKDMTLEANYVGTLGRKLIGIQNRNTFDGRLVGGNSARPNPIFGNDNARMGIFGSNYNALQVSLRKRFSHGLSLNANYTYAKSLDEVSDAFREKNGQTSVTDVENIKNDYGPSDFDIRHRIVVDFNYDLPLFHGNRWLGGWTVNSIISWNTGSPIGFVDSAHDANQDGSRTDRPEFIGPGSVIKSIVGKEENGTYQYLDPAQYGASNLCLTNPAIDNHGGLWCNPNLGRGAVPGPMFTNIDFGVSKGFKINERMAFRFDANFFDLLNHPNFENPSTGGGGANVASGNFGQSTSTYGDTGGHRVTQLALRFEF